MKNFLAVFLVLLFAGAAPGADAVGSVEASVPQSWAQRGGAKSELNAGDGILVSDTIATDGAGKLDVKFEDGTTIALGPNSEATINDFIMSDTKNNFSARIGKGAARVVTGDLVKRNPNGFKVTTPRATVGIRGTTLTFGIDSKGNEVVSVSDLGDNSHVTIIDRNGRRFTIATPGNSVVFPAGRDAFTVQNSSEIDALLEQIMNYEGQQPGFDGLVNEFLKEVESQRPSRQDDDAGARRDRRGSSEAAEGLITPNQRKEINVVVNSRPTPRSSGSCE